MPTVAEVRPESEVEQVLGVRRRKRRRWPWVVAALFTVALVSALCAVGTRSSSRGPLYEQAPAEVGEITLTVVAVGTVEPRDQVEIGSEQSGVVRTVHVDVNDQVVAGQALAELDTSLLDAQVAQARAQVLGGEGSVAQARASEAAAKRTLDRAEGLAGTPAQSQVTLDDARSAWEQSHAAVAVARGQLAQARAALDVAEVNLRKAVIRSPIDGVVLERNVEPGQSVVSALQAVTLFTVAADLERMSVEVDVDEADIGRLAPGQAATFTVAARPDRVFDAVVRVVHPAPVAGAQVVAYQAVLDLENPEGLLLPGMTATVEIVTDHREDVLLVPDAALRFAPPNTDLPPVEARDGRRWSRVWVLGEDGPQPVEVVPGASDGRHTVVVAGDLQAGQVVITGLAPRGRS